MATKEKTKVIFGWIAIAISVFFSSFWAFWGIVENFHEGWYFRSIWSNILLMFGQYLLVPIIFVIISLVTLRWQKIGGILHIILGIFFGYFFSGLNAAILFILIPFLGLGVIYYFSILPNKKIASAILIGIPLIIILGFGAFHGIRVANRFNDDNLNARIIKGNGVELMWAPAGPGWPEDGMPWEKAKSICAHLNEDGKTLSDSVKNIWRLPTVDEAVKSMVYHGNNAGGVFNTKTKTADYKNDPDKESPLWNMYSKVVYWWTSDEASDKLAYIVVYNGGVWPRTKTLNVGYLAFRAVKEIK